MSGKGKFFPVLGLGKKERIRGERHHARFARKSARRWNPVIGALGTAAGKQGEERDGEQ